MTVVRFPDRRSYTVIDNEAVNDPRLSLRARGLHHYMLSKPDAWDFSSERIAAEVVEGRDAIRAAMRELEAAGYLTRQREQDAKSGQWRSWIEVYERSKSPITGDGFSVVGATSTFDGNPQVNPTTGKPTVGKPGAQASPDEQTTRNYDRRLSMEAIRSLARTRAETLHVTEDELRHELDSRDCDEAAIMKALEVFRDCRARLPEQEGIAS